MAHAYRWAQQRSKRRLQWPNGYRLSLLSRDVAVDDPSKNTDTRVLPQPLPLQDSQLGVRTIPTLRRNTLQRSTVRGLRSRMMCARGRLRRAQEQTRQKVPRQI